MDKIIVITGPTGVGKTKLSVSLAKKLNGEIINADSMQIYKGLNIGTAKITESEKEGVVHHLFDIKDVSEDYSIFDYQKDARSVIEDIKFRGKVPILVGGTGLYIKSALYDYKLNFEKSNDSYEDLSCEELYDILIKLDPNVIVDKNNKRRLIRAINYYKENGKSISENKTNKLLYDTIFIGLTTERSKLYEIINNRVDKMFEMGLEEEVKHFYDNNIYTKPIINGIGYKELYKYFDGEITLEESKDLIKKNSRHYAKRQYTFFNNQMDINWFNVNFDNFAETIDEVEKYIYNVNDK